MQKFPSPLACVGFVSKHLKNLKLIDGSWYMPQMGRNADAEFLKARIPGAVRFDIDSVCRKDTTLPHMVPPQEQFERQVSQLGINTNDHLIVYDAMNVFSACRVYWTFKYFGHKHVAVLNGGLPAWMKAGLPVHSGTPAQPTAGFYTANPQAQLLRTLNQIKANIQTWKSGGKGEIVLDARPKARFTGQAPDPRGLPSGHMPFSKSLPFTDLIDPATGQFHEPQVLRKLFADIDLENDKIITSCGSGVTASIIYVALESLGAKHISEYDGSWSEYAEDPSAEILKSI